MRTKGDGRGGKTLKEETLEEAITRNPKREKHKKGRGRQTLY